jgi:hypothetical protein
VNYAKKIKNLYSQSDNNQIKIIISLFKIYNLIAIAAYKTLNFNNYNQCNNKYINTILINHLNYLLIWQNNNIFQPIVFSKYVSIKYYIIKHTSLITVIKFLYFKNIISNKLSNSSNLYSYHKMVKIINNYYKWLLIPEPVI